ncbi:MAG: hypothetical protein M3Y56_15710 [Armatimonadota bacterium]|nr:hypothetical protein [Armatimonadota bacterium]
MRKRRNIIAATAALLTRGVVRLADAGTRIVTSSTQGLQDLYQEAKSEYDSERASVRTVGGFNRERVSLNLHFIRATRFPVGNVIIAPFCTGIANWKLIRDRNRPPQTWPTQESFVAPNYASSSSPEYGDIGRRWKAGAQETQRLTTGYCHFAA